MLSVLYSAAGGLDVAAKSQEVLARNIANAQHQGYKRATLRFADELRQAGGSTALTAIEGVGFDQGQLLRTDSPMDMALEGDGFFTLQDANGGSLYTRKGSFVTGTDGRIVTSSGFTVLGTSGPILLPPGCAITVQKDGSILANGETIGKFRIAAFPDKSSLSRAGTTLFKETGPASRAMPALDFTVRQGFLENSNVNILTEMVRMIENARAFEANQRAASSANTALTELNRTAET
ncbi:MAG TPA: flagellar hook basal-body protein [Planctomycetota bacterium]|nr:flagellar hook basal-body protein [Planctomycetota bacterium]